MTESTEPDYDALIERARRRSKTNEDLGDQLLLIELADALTGLKEENDVMNSAIEGVELDVQEKLLTRLITALERHAKDVPTGTHGISMVITVLRGLREKIQDAQDKL